MLVSSAHKRGIRPSPEFAGSLLINALPDIHLLAKTMATGGVKRQQFDSRQPASFCPPLPRTGPISKSEDAKIFRPAGSSARIKPTGRMAAITGRSSRGSLVAIHLRSESAFLLPRHMSASRRLPRAADRRGGAIICKHVRPDWQQLARLVMYSGVSN
jgi:hypothetical protein